MIEQLKIEAVELRNQKLALAQQLSTIQQKILVLSGAEEEIKHILEITGEEE